MATQVGKGVVDIVPEFGNFQRDVSREVEKTTSKASKVASNALKFGAVASATVTAPIVAGMKGALDAASDLNESMNAVDKSFGEAAEGVMELGEQAAQSLGLSNADFNSLAVRFSSFAKTVAGEGGDVVGTLDDLTTRSADFASVMNIDVAEAATKFQSGLAGETEPLRQFGIDLSAAAVEAHALETGIVDSAGAMSEAEKVQARYSLLMEQTAQFAGDFADTSDDAANAQRIAAAEWENARATLGESLLPIMSDAAQAAGSMAEAFNRLPESGQKAVLAVGGLAAAVGPLSVVFGGSIKAVQGMKKALDAFRAAQAAKVAFDTADGFKAIGATASSGLPSVQGLSKAALGIGAAAVGVYATAAALDAAFGSNRDIAATAAGLEAMAETGASAQWEAATGGVEGLADSLNLLFPEGGWESRRRGTLRIASFIGVDELDEASESVGALDDALAGLVTAGELDKAQVGFSQLAEAAEQADVPLDTLINAMPALKDALAGAGLEVSDLVDDTAGLGPAADHASRGVERAEAALQSTRDTAKPAKTAINDIAIEYRNLDDAAQTVDEALSNLSDRFRDMLGGQRDVRAATSNWEASLDGLTESIKENGSSLDLSTEKGRANESAIRAAQDAAVDHSLAVLEETGSIDKANDALDQHREDLFDVLVQSGMSEDAARKYTEEILKIPDDAETRAEFDDALANESIARYIDAIDDVPIEHSTFGKFFGDYEAVAAWMRRLEEITRTRYVNVRASVSPGGVQALHGGTDWWPGGPAVVNDAPGGTQGELIHLPGGAAVTPSKDSVKMLAAAIKTAGGGAGGPTINWYRQDPPDAVDRFDMRQFARAYA